MPTLPSNLYDRLIKQIVQNFDAAAMDRFTTIRKADILVTYEQDTPSNLAFQDRVVKLIEKMLHKGTLSEFMKHYDDQFGSIFDQVRELRQAIDLALESTSEASQPIDSANNHLETFRLKALRLLTEPDLDDFFEYINEALEGSFGSLSSTILVNQGSYNQLKREKARQIISEQHFTMRMAQIRNAMDYVVKEVRLKDLK